MMPGAYLRGRTNTAMARAMTEDELLQAITEAATYLGWRWFHIRRSDLAIAQGHSGFPDLCLARDGRVIFLELKTMVGILSESQRAWLEAIGGTADVDSMIVTPDRLDQALTMLGVTVRG